MIFLDSVSRNQSSCLFRQLCKAIPRIKHSKTKEYRHTMQGSLLVVRTILSVPRWLQFLADRS